ncbi:MAG: adenosylcobinamide-GDP ribazoletransferase [Bacillus sp. (in: firmicutes)]
MKNVFYGAVLALQFLTRFPLPISCDISPASLKWALRFFPFAGLVMGCFIVLISYALHSFLSVPLLVLAGLTAWVYATGGLHLDGVMDVADAVGSNASLEKKYEIMKDSRVGSFAVIALIFLVLWKAALLYEIFSQWDDTILIALLFIPALSRFQALFLLYFFKPIQNKGLAHEWRKHLSKSDLLIAFIWVGAIAVFCKPLFILIPCQLLFTFMYGRWAMKQFKGVNGDLVGTSIEGAELWNLTILYILLLSVMA